MPRRGDQQHNFPSVPAQPTRAGRIGIRLVRAADQTGTLRDIAFDPSEFRCARLAGELADEWVDYAETSGISRDWVSHGRRAIRNFCTTADLLLGENAHRASLATQNPDIAAVVAEWERALPTGFRAGSPTPAGYAGSVRALIARRAEHDQRPVTAALCRLVDGAKGVPSGSSRELDEFTRADKRALIRAAWVWAHQLDARLANGWAGDGLDDVSEVFGLDGTRKGDKVIRPRGGVAIVTEEKCTKPVSEAKARVLLGEAMRNRGAALGMLIVEDETKVPGNQPYHLIDDDKVVVAANPVTLRLVYCLMRSKAIEAAQAVRAVDDHAAVEALGEIRGHIDDIARALDRFKLIRTEHTKATKAIAQAAGYVDDLGAVITDDVTEITLLIKEVVGDDHPEEAA
jgi:hypothetical protein